jgi:4-amino-4-deoxy-L-arabinose transferase-like glycosyltransferase
VPLVAVGAGAFALRLFAVDHTPHYRPRHDDHSYVQHALALVQTHAYPVFHLGHEAVPTAYRPPGFPVFLAVAHELFGPGLRPQRLAQVLVGVAVVILIGVVARQLWGPRTGLIAAALAAISPVLVLFGATLESEPLFTALMLAALSCALAARTRRGDGRRVLAWATAAGVLAGLASLTRPEGLAVALAVALCAGSRRAGLVVVLATVVCVAPWTIRNAITMHAFVPVSTAAGNTLAGTYNSVSLHDGRWRDPRLSHLYPAVRAAHRGNEPGRDRALRHAVLEFILAHPTAPLQIAAHNVPRVTGLAPVSFSRVSLKTVSLTPRPAPLLRVALIVTTVLGLAGAATAAARRAPPGWWAAGAIVLLVALLVNAEQRFTVSLQPFLLLLAPLPFTRGT